MSKFQARVLILMLAHRRIPFIINREGEKYLITFDQTYVTELRMSVGATL